MMYTITCGFLVLGILCGFALARKGHLRAFIAILGCLSLFFGYVVMAPGSAFPGDRFAIHYAAFAVCLPMIGGVFGGGLFGWFVRRHFGPA